MIPAFLALFRHRLRERAAGSCALIRCNSMKIPAHLVLVLSMSAFTFLIVKGEARSTCRSRFWLHLRHLIAPRLPACRE